MYIIYVLWYRLYAELNLASLKFCCNLITCLCSCTMHFFCRNAVSGVRGVDSVQSTRCNSIPRAGAFFA